MYFLVRMKKINLMNTIKIILLIGMVSILPSFHLLGQQTDYLRDIQAMEKLWQQPNLHLRMLWKTSSQQQDNEDVIDYWKKKEKYQYTLSTTKTLVVGNDKVQLVIHHDYKEVVLRINNKFKKSMMVVPDSIRKGLGEPKFREKPNGHRVYVFEGQNNIIQHLEYEFRSDAGEIYPVRVKMVYFQPQYGQLTTEIKYKMVQTSPTFQDGLFRYLTGVKSSSSGYQTIGILKDYRLIQANNDNR